MSLLETLVARVGAPAMISPWIVIDQPRIDAFAEVTEDRQFLHVDPERAAQAVFGGTVAHGFLTLSMLSRLLATTDTALPPIAEGVNYGLDRVRFLAPVPAGARIRGHFALAGAEGRAEARILLRYDVSIEVEGSPRPALAATWLVLLRFEGAA